MTDDHLARARQHRARIEAVMLEVESRLSELHDCSHDEIAAALEALAVRYGGGVQIVPRSPRDAS